MINDWVYPLGGLFTVVGGIALFLQMRRASEEQQVVILEEHTHADKAALEKSKTDLETRLSTSEEATQSYKQEALSLQGKVHHLEKDLAHLQQHLQEREEENSHLRQQAAQFKQSSESLHQQFSQLEVFHEQLKASHQREIQELQKSKEGLSLRLQQEMSKLADLRSQVLGLEQNQKRQQQQAIRVQELEKSQQDWSAEKSALVAQSQLQLERVETLERALEQEQITVKVLNSQIESLQKTIAEWESQYQGAIALTDNLNLQVQTLETQQGEWQALEGDLRQQLAGLEDLEQQAKSQGEVLTTQVQTLEDQIKTLEASLETDRQGFLQAQAQWESDRQGFLNAQTQWESDRQDFLNAQTQWESDRQSLEMTQKTQESAYQDLKSQFDILQEQWEALSTDKAGLESQLQAEQFKVADLEQQLTKLQASTVLANEATVPEKSAQSLETNEVSSVSTESKSPKRSGKKVSKTKALEPHIEPQTLAAEISEGKVEPEAIAVETVETISLDSSELPASELSSEVSNETTSIPTTIIETAIDTAPSAPEIAAEELPSVTAEMVEIHHDTETTAAEMVHEPALLADKKFIILGTLSHIDRDRAKELIQTAGGTLMSSPSAKTDYALVGKSPGEKLKKVQKLGISQLSESQFLKLLGIES